MDHPHDVVGGTLRMGFQPGTIVHTAAPLVLRITVPRIEELSISGSGDIVGQSVIRADRLSLTIEGSGNIRVAVNAEILAPSIHGSGDVTCGGDPRVTVKSSGPGTLRRQ